MVNKLIILKNMIIDSTSQEEINKLATEIASEISSKKNVNFQEVRLELGYIESNVKKLGGKQCQIRNH